MIKVTNVTKHFGDFKVLDEVSLNVRKGTVYGLIGANGAGKTTLINHINGFMQPESGEITVGGEKIFDNKSAKKKILNISDDWFYYGSFNVRDMMKFYRDMYPDFNMERYQAIGKALDIDEKRQINRLSKGMKKQVAFWLSLSAMPDVLILDEPLDGLDPVLRKMILNMVIGDVADRQMTVLVSSHNLRELEDICDWVGIIHKGKMIAEKPLDDVKGNLHKYQIVVPEDHTAELENMEGILHTSRVGSVYSIIIRGEKNETDEKLKALEPSLCDRISLTHEEVFIYELGGLGYDFKNILI